MENYEFPQIDEMIEEESEIEEEPENKNPLQGIVDFYNKTVAEADERGFANTFKEVTERFFKGLNEHLQHDYNTSFTPVDVEYGDGYFIFGHGTNSVVSFHIEENKDWLFGIWWSPVKKFESENEYETDRVRCEFFAQFEPEIDKFKPSASTFVSEFQFYVEDDKTMNWTAYYHATNTVLLIIKEPILAWYREIHYVDFNVEYVERQTAIDAYVDYWYKRRNREKMKAKNDRNMLAVTYYIFKPMVDSGDAYMIDRGENVSPRYELVIKNKWNTGEDPIEDGCYDMFDFGIDWDEREDDKALWDSQVEVCKKRADDIDSYWYNSVSHCILLVSEERYNYWKDKDKVADLTFTDEELNFNKRD